jgi:DNA-binding NtrC family response regulator
MNAKLLIVEADDLFRQNLARGLSNAGLKVFPTDVAEQAEEIIKRKDCDVVLIGLLGLGREGLRLLRSIKELRPLTEVILIAGQEQLALSIEGMKLGAFDDFRIPLDMQSLLQRVQEACKQRKDNLKAKKKSFTQRCQDFLVAASFAEAGEFDVARQISDRSKNVTRPEENNRRKSNSSEKDTREEVER